MTAKTPQKLTESKGFKQLMDEAGLSDEFLYNCLAEDIEAKPKRRVEELRLAGKWKGLEQNKLDVAVEYTDMDDETFKKLIARGKNLI